MVAEKHIPPGKRFRLGGLVKPGSLVRGDNLAVTFKVADGSATLPVAYKGILPDLFREGQGVVAEGALDASGVFKADTVLAKHDETYMPKDVADALKKQGHWKDDYGAKAGSSAQQAARASPGSIAVIAEAGHYALVLALALALIQSTVPILGARWRDPALMNVARSTALAQLLFVAASFAALVTLHVTSDFSVVNVFENSHSLKPLIYKITGVWGNHEGSMLLWVSILALFGGLVAAFGNNLPLSLRAHVLAVQAWIASAFYLFILITSNPFLRIANPPIEGRDLNPVLQDIGLAVHPPMLYLGYVGFSISFSFAVAALLEGRIDAAWARWVRPWTLVAWIFLTLGIAMGSYWAYYELGWGGWWFWDPVENASLMPWLAGTALLHSAVVMEKRNALKVWTILLSILTFSLSLLGTFLVRSGVLTSVHAFATDPTRGVFILLILCIFIGGSLSLYAWRASALKQGGLFAPISREGALVLNNLFLTTACATVFIGTLYPLALEVITGDKISVGAPFFNLTFAPLFVPLDDRGAVRAVAGVEARRSARRRAAADRGRHRGADRDRGGVGMDARRQRFRAAGDRACGVRHRRRVERSRRAHRPVPRAVRDRAAARARVAALDLGHGVRPCRRRRRPDRDRLRDHLEQRIYRIDEAGRRRQHRRLRTEARRRDAAAGAEFSRNGGAVHGQPRRRSRSATMTPSKRNFTTRGIDHDRGRAADARRQPALYLAWRYRRRRRDRGADLSQAAGAADLVRSGADGVRRHAVAVGPAACASARRSRRRPPRGLQAAE